MSDMEPFAVEEPAEAFKPARDTRPRMPEPLPVRLIAVGDVRLPAVAGIERELDGFYVEMLQFVRDEPLYELIYRADNFRILFDLQEGLIQRDGYRPQGIEVLSLADAEQKLIDREIEYVRQRGIQPGSQTLLLSDPAGNLIELVEVRRIL